MTEQSNGAGIALANATLIQLLSKGVISLEDMKQVYALAAEHPGLDSSSRTALLTVLGTLTTFEPKHPLVGGKQDGD